MIFKNKMIDNIQGWKEYGGKVMLVFYWEEYQLSCLWLVTHSGELREISGFIIHAVSI